MNGSWIPNTSGALSFLAKGPPPASDFPVFHTPDHQTESEKFSILMIEPALMSFLLQRCCSQLSQKTTSNHSVLRRQLPSNQFGELAMNHFHSSMVPEFPLLAKHPGLWVTTYYHRSAFISTSLFTQLPSQPHIYLPGPLGR